MTHAEGAAPARAALAGNPSDGYGGAVVAVALEGLHARARARAADRLTVSPRSPLARAAAERFAREYAPDRAGALVEWETTIPRSVGLGGSSAIVIAILRALAELWRVDLAPAELADLALAVEVEELGIAAGPQDRVAQAHGGLTFMDFSSRPPRYERLDPDLLPPSLIAWRPGAGGESGAVHAPLRERYERGEPAVVGAMAKLARLAHEARRALQNKDFAALAGCMDGSFDVRARILDLDRRHVEMIECARATGAAANYAGSGGAIVALCADEASSSRVECALRAIGCAVHRGSPSAAANRRSRWGPDGSRPSPTG